MRGNLYKGNILVCPSCGLQHKVDFTRIEQQPVTHKLETISLTPDGSSSNPWQVSSKADLEKVGSGTDGWNMNHYYELTCDIDLGNSNFEPIGYDSGWGYTAFTGHFDGKGYKIYNGSIGSAGVDYSSDNYIGIFAWNEGTIQNVGVDGVDVTGRARTAGLAGYNDGTIQNCYATGDIIGANDTGGLVGYNNDTVKNCYATGDITGEGIYVGGLVGQNWGTLENCYATGNVGGMHNTGGLTGRNFLLIKNCYATGNVSGNYYVGGLVGSINATIENCYATGDVDGDLGVGGLVGYNNQSAIRYSYSTGKPTGDSDVGGLVGSKKTDGNYEDTNNYWDKTTSEIDTSAMGTGKTTAEMKDIDTFIDWDIVLIGDYVDEDWKIDDGKDYPRLGWEKVIFSYSGSGGIELFGSAIVSFGLFYITIASGGVVVSGSADIYWEIAPYIYIASGGIVVRGSADILWSKILSYIASGGIKVSGEGLIIFGLSHIASGGVKVSGEALSVWDKIFSSIASGGVKLSGEGLYQLGLSYIADGGVVVSGEAITDWGIHPYIYIGSGGIVVLSPKTWANRNKPVLFWNDNSKSINPWQDHSKAAGAWTDKSKGINPWSNKDKAEGTWKNHK